MLFGLSSGAWLGFAMFAFAGFGIYSFLTGKTASDLLGGIVAAITGTGGSIADMYMNYSMVLSKGLQFEAWGFSLLAAGVIIFILVMIMNVLTSRNNSFVQ